MFTVNIFIQDAYIFNDACSVCHKNKHFTTLTDTKIRCFFVVIRTTNIYFQNFQHCVYVLLVVRASVSASNGTLYFCHIANQSNVLFSLLC